MSMGCLIRPAIVGDGYILQELHVMTVGDGDDVVCEVVEEEPRSSTWDRPSAED